MNNNKEYDYDALAQERERDRIIREENEKTYMSQQKSKYTSEQQEKAENDAAGQEIRQHYDEVLWPSINDINYYVCYAFSLVYLLLIRLNPEKEFSCIAYLLFLVIAIVIRVMERIDRKTDLKTKKIFRCFNDFVNHTSIYGYILTAVGFMSVESDKWLFGIIYSLLLMVFVVRSITDLFIPAIKK